MLLPPTLRVLVVEDEELVLASLEQLLEHLGHRVRAELGSVAALELFERNPQAFDLVTVDYMMPDMNGLQLAQRILRLRPEIPIIMVSAMLDVIAPEAIAAAGICAIVSKPFRLRDLVVAISKALTPDPAAAGEFPA